jgi:hypothetical protein
MTQTADTLTGTTARPVTFSHRDRDGISHPRKFDAGQTVYVTRIKDDGTCTIRIAGSLYEQRVHITTVTPA